MTGLRRAISLKGFGVAHTPIEVEAYDRRKLTRDRVWFVLWRGLVVGLTVGFGPLLFNNESAGRLGIVAVLVGFAALGFACFIFRQMLSAGPFLGVPQWLHRMSRLIKPPRILAKVLAEVRMTVEEDRTSTRFQTAKPWRGPTLRLAGVDLRGAMLPRIDLTGAELTGALFDGANLQAAILREAVLVEASLRGTDLRGANLEGARLTGCRFDGATYDDRTVWPGNAPGRGAKHARLP